jgi:transcriptional regulator with XRE-family HTH domain
MEKRRIFMSETATIRTETIAPQVDSETAEQFIAEKHIGERIKRLRLKKSMGLVELGRHTGLSASFLSQLETGRVVPTLRNLARVAMVFSKDLSYFFEPEPQSLFRVHRRKERVRLPQTGVDDPSYYFESLGYMVPDVHAGYEFLYVLQGELEIRHGDHVAQMETGDAVYFDASTAHAYLCSSKTPAVALIVTMHQPPTATPTVQLRPLGTTMPTRSTPPAPVRVVR